MSLPVKIARVRGLNEVGAPENMVGQEVDLESIKGTIAECYRFNQSTRKREKIEVPVTALTLMDGSYLEALLNDSRSYREAPDQESIDRLHYWLIPMLREIGIKDGLQKVQNVELGWEIESAGIWLSWSQVATVKLESKSDGAVKRQEIYAWIYGTSVHIPGVHYYKDGSGQPDDLDMIELGVFRVGSESALAKDVSRHIIDNRLDMILNSMSEEFMYIDDLLCGSLEPTPLDRLENERERIAAEQAKYASGTNPADPPYRRTAKEHIDVLQTQIERIDREIRRRTLAADFAQSELYASYLPYNSDLVRIDRHRVSVTQGKVLLYYNGEFIIRYGDDIALRDGQFQGRSDEYWEAIMRRNYSEGDPLNHLRPIKEKFPKPVMGSDDDEAGQRL